MFRNIKIQLAAQLFVSLVFAMLLINIVAAVFWYHSFIFQKVDYLKSIMHVALIAEYSEGQEKKHNIRGVYNEIATVLGGKHVRVLLAGMENGEIIVLGHSDNANIIHIIKESLKTGKEVVRRVQGVEKVNTLAMQTIGFAFSVKNPEGNNIAIGAIIDDASILKIIWEKQKIIFVYILLNAIILSIIVFFRTRRLFLDPLDKLVNVAESYRIKEDGELFNQISDSEIGQLSKAMHSMVQRIERDRDNLRHAVHSLAEANDNLKKVQKEVVMAEKMSAVGRLSAGLAHEIGNPLSIVQGYIELLANNDLSCDEREQFCKRGYAELARIDALIRQLLNMSRKSATQMDVFDLCLLVKDVIDLLELSINRNGSCIKLISEGGPFMIRADPEMLRQVVLNILLNSLDAITTNEDRDVPGEICVKMTNGITAENHIVVLQIIDNGEGIPAENIEHIFEPFYTTKAPGKGTGLGLAIAERIVRSSGGTIDVNSVPGQGASFIIKMPLVTGQLAVEGAP